MTSIGNRPDEPDPYETDDPDRPDEWLALSRPYGIEHLWVEAQRVLGSDGTVAGVRRRGPGPQNWEAGCSGPRLGELWIEGYDAIEAMENLLAHLRKTRDLERLTGKR